MVNTSVMAHTPVPDNALEFAHRPGTVRLRRIHPPVRSVEIRIVWNRGHFIFDAVESCAEQPIRVVVATRGGGGMKASQKFVEAFVLPPVHTLHARHITPM